MGDHMNAIGELESSGEHKHECDFVLDHGASMSESAVAPQACHGLEYYRRIPAFAVLQHAAETVGRRDAVRYGDKV